ncbi:MAG: class I SAM-dependent methyltransferase [Clostridiales bacterium]|nr:class I SAM-dependent methyltransferase [Clostridiales bacterium]
MGLYKKFVNQTRKPEGVLGKLMVNGMNGGHAKLADWGMSYLPNITPDDIVDLGCGGGRNAGELANRYQNAHVIAIDYSPVSVKKASSHNRKWIEGGRMLVKQGDVSHLRLPSGKTDLATAFETIYFWPGLERCFSEVYKILKPGGTFLIVNESDGTDETSLKFQKIIDGMHCYTAYEIDAALKNAGFLDVNVTHHENKPWISVVAKKGV